MSIFSSIKDAIFSHPAAAAQQQQQQQPAMADASQQQAQPAPAPASQLPVDVEAVLTEISSEKGNPQLNWQSSIVDLMKLLGIDSSLANREQLATELGYTGPKDGSADMNIWLHKATMKALADNGGRVPANMMV